MSAASSFFYIAKSEATALTCVLNHGSHCHPSVALLAPLVTVGGRIVSAAEVRAQVEDTLNVDAGDVRCGERTYPDVFSLSRPRWVLLVSRMENQGGTRTKWAHIWVPSQWLLTRGFLITCPAKQEPFRIKLRPLMGEPVDGTSLCSFW